LAWIVTALAIPTLITGQLFLSYKERLEALAVVEREKLETERANRQARVLSHWDDFMADRRALASLSMYGPVVGGDNGMIEDAGFLLSLVVPWQPRIRRERSAAFTRALDSYREQIRSDRRELFEGLGGDVALRMRVRSWGDDYALHARDVVVPPRANFLSDLRSYQRWDLEEDTPRSKFRPSDPVERYMDQPAPDFQILDDWAKLRLLQGLRNHELPVAVADVRHLARLLVTTEDPQALNLVSALLCSIVRAQDQDGARDPQALLECKLAHHHHLAIGGLLTPGLPGQKLTAVLDESAPGVCATLNAALPFWQALRHYLAPMWPEFYQQLDALVAAPTPCRLTHARTDWGPANADTFRRFVDADRKPDTDATERFLLWFGYHFDALLRNVALRYAVSQYGLFERRYPR